MNVNLELTDRCNIRCRMCSQSMREEAHGAPMTFMDFPTWRRALLGLKGLPDVHLCPHWLGEPTLHPQFESFVEYAFAINQGNQYFHRFKLHTNAVIFPEARARRLLRLAQRQDQSPDTFEAIHFSIDAFSPASYRFVKGADRREQVYKNILRFLELRAALGLARPVVHLSFVVQEGNHTEAPAFVDYWAAVLRRLGRAPRLESDWPPFDSDALYLRRLNAGDQAAADALHAAACEAAGVQATARKDGSF